MIIMEMNGRKTNKNLCYLAAPYSHKEHYMLVARFILINRVAAKLMAEGNYIFSPISHTHPIAEASNGILPRGWEYWEGYDRTMIKCCDRLIVLRLPGWETSTGVQAEIQIAREYGITMEYIDYEPFRDVALVVASEMEKEDIRTKELGPYSNAEDKRNIVQQQYNYEGFCIGTFIA